MISQDLQQKFKSVQKEITRKQVEKETLEKFRDEYMLKQSKDTESLNLYRETRKLLELCSKSTEHKIQTYIEPIVTEAFEFVFSQNLQFHLLFANRRNQVEVDFIILRSDESEAEYQKYVKDPKKYEKQLEQLTKETRNINFLYGGAVNQVLALVLRLILVELLGIKGPVLLDEPSSAVGEEYSVKLGQLIASLSKRFNRQVILVTHSEQLASYADTVYSVKKSNNVSSIECIN